jgi:hypothetical protein
MMKLRYKLILPAFFLFARIVMIISMPIEGIRGYGDYWNYLRIAESGWPYINTWVEFPPIFPWITRILYLISPNQHGFEYLLAILFSLVQAGSLYLFMRLTEKIIRDTNTRIAVDTIYAMITLVLPYGWWTFDCLTILFIMLALVAFFDENDLLFGIAVALGILTKLFPALLLVLPIRYYPFRRMIKIIGIAGGIVLGVYLTFGTISSKMTIASVTSQFIKGSWETPWALIDGNFQTGNFSSQIDHSVPETASISTGNPSAISPWVTLAIFLGIGYLVFRTYDPLDKENSISLLGITFCLFFLWSPGWSPQWSLYFLPLFLLGLPFGSAVLVSCVFILINLLEWPMLLSRGMFTMLPLTIGLRTILFILIALLFWQNRSKPEQISSPGSSPDIHGVYIE